MAISPFRIDVDESVLQDLRVRLRATRWPDQIPGTTWEYGTDITYLRSLVDYWASSFDWRKQEAMLNQFDQFRTEIDGVGLHFIHARGKGPNPAPLILIHGWPGSFFEMYKVIGPLTDPAAHGADPAASFDVVVPSLPGFAFSGPTTQTGVSHYRAGELLHKLMTEQLGYRRYGAQGGDWGAIISTSMARMFPQSLTGIHLNMLTGRMTAGDPVDDHEKEQAARAAHFAQEETGYQRIQGSKPQTLGYGLNDSPAGLAAWIVEKWRTWSDCDGDVERTFTRDEILTNITLYWVTGTINSSTRIYYESAHSRPNLPMTDKVDVPTGVADFPKEIYRASRRQAETFYNVQHWTEMPHGGHFAALEEPQRLTGDVRAFFRRFR
ncbi:MAG TPA: epoxide hydrolase [Dehalococcoidia bacterium]